MSSNEKQTQANPAGQQGQQQHFPPPPPGPPPIQTSSQAQPPKHSNETPLPDYDIPAYNTSHPQFAPPPVAADGDIYDASPIDEHAPKLGHHHQHGSDGEGKKKSNRLSAMGEAFASKVSGPVNALAHKFGSEGFLPESLDKECEKAARILRGFCKDGIYSDAAPAAPPSPEPTAGTKPPPSPSSKQKKSRVLLTIPSKVIARAQGLAIFTAVRLGFHASGSSGSGVLLARLPDGSWSPPSAIQITSIGAGFVAGVDIYDCVVVINTREALDLFTKTRLSLGSDLAVTAGPFGAGGALNWGVPSPGSEKAPPLPPRKPAAEADYTAPPPLSADNTHFTTPPVPETQQGMGSGSEDEGKHGGKPAKPNLRESIKSQKNLKPVYSYVKSRGLFAGVQIDGTVIAAREGANAKFYGQAVPVEKILRGEVPAGGAWSAAARGLFDVLRGAEGWRGQQGQQQQGAGAAAVGTGLVAGPNSPAFGAAPGTGGAPASAWVAPPPPPAGRASMTAAAAVPAPQGVAGVTAGMRNLDVSGAAGAGPSSAAAVPPPPPATATATSAAASAKAAEAAAEAARAEPDIPPPPVYSEPHGAEELPPAYDEEHERHRPAGAGADSKGGSTR